MNFICPLCEKSIDHSLKDCDKIKSWFYQLDGKSLWRIRLLSKYEYQFLTEDEFSQLQSKENVILDEASHWTSFDSNTFSGINSVGHRTSIFTEH